MNTPDWLTQRDRTLKLGSDGKTWFALFAGQPNYSLVAVPVAGKFGCAIRRRSTASHRMCGGCLAAKTTRSAAGLTNCARRWGGVNRVYV